MSQEPKDDLARYRDKRDARATPEPFTSSTARPGLFVVQQHEATRLHFDLRLELGGTLKSWAVPKGPSYEQADKRLAIQVEDHPLEYADFEGVIPAGNYGAGSVIVWDRGRWTALEDPVAGLEKGKLLFELEGYKLRGRWTLVRTKRSDKDWLLIKERDGWEGKEHQRLLTPESVLSGLTVGELATGRERGEALAREAEAAGASRARVDPRSAGLMLAATAEKPFSSPDWIYELKYDGYRVLAARAGERPLLLLRGGGEATRSFPEIARALAALPCEDVVLDGEIVVLDREGRPSFAALQRRAHLERAPDVERAVVQQPATAYCFDLLALAGLDLRPLPLVTRKALLRRLLPARGPLRWLDHVEEHGEAFYREVERRGLEGVMAKRKDARYRAGRHDDWQKLRVDRLADLVVVGMSAPRGTRSGFGALHLATPEPAGAGGGGGLRFCGSVGSGFSEKDLARIARELEAARLDSPPCAGAVPKGRGHTWSEPRLVCEVRFREWTEDRVLRQPVFVRLRDDKTPAECEPVGPAAAEPPPTPSAAGAARPEAARGAPADPAEPPPAVKVTNPGKVFWPDDGYTKGDLVAYYRAIAPAMLPYLKGRPLVLTRYPDGIAGKHFFQKDAPAQTPAWIGRFLGWSEETHREIEYLVCESEPALAHIANLGTIPIHVWASRVATPDRPDWCILDLDPKEAPFAHVVRIARAAKELCDAIGIPCFAKTSGATGMHVLLPLGARWGYPQARMLAELLARVLVRRLPEIATVMRQPERRGGRVYVDYGQNGQGKLIAAPYCVRPRPLATVSTPVEWDEVDETLDPRRFTIVTVPPRVRSLARDPLAGVLEPSPGLEAAVAKLAPLAAEADR
jgi:bifunctional non-homologous end joining protein LigD